MATHCEGSFRNLKKLDLGMFRERMKASSVSIQSAATEEDFANQLETDIVKAFDELARICTSTKGQDKAENRWLSQEAVVAKQERHWLERKWKSIGLETV